MTANKLTSNKLQENSNLSYSDIVGAVSDHFCLPALQRGFVWSKDDIATFFDSIFKGFPVGSLLLWKLKTEKDRNAMVFYPINTNEEKNELRGSKKIYNFENEKKERFCVIDGQQRITALYKGLTQNYVENKKKYQLYFNVLYNGKDYSAFKYFRSNKGGVYKEKEELWIPIKEIWNVNKNKRNSDAFLKEYEKQHYDNKEFYKTVSGKQIRKTTKLVKQIDDQYDYYKKNIKTAKDNYNKLCKVLKNGALPFKLIDLRKINSYENDNIEKMFEVFVRLNKNGKPLNPTDLLFAKLSKNNKKEELWELFDNLILDINSINNPTDKKSRFSQDNILRFIWLTHRTDYSSFNSFFITNKGEISINDESIEKIIKAFTEAKKIYKEGLFTYDRNTPYSMFLPVAYYFYRGGKNSDEARIEIEKYYEASLIMGVFSQSTDTVMSNIIKAFGKNKRNNITLFDRRCFNYKKLVKKLREENHNYFDISENDLQEILNMNYNKDLDSIRIVLHLLSRNMNVQVPGIHEVDHMHPKKFKDKETEFYSIVGGKSTKNELLWDFYKKNVDNFSNLQLLEGHENKGDKNDKLLNEWLNQDKYKNNLDTYSINNFVIDDSSKKIDIEYFKLENFETFYKNRYSVLLSKLKEMFPPNEI